MDRKHQSLLGCTLLLALGCSSSSNPTAAGGGNANGGSNTSPSGTGGNANGGASETSSANANGGITAMGGAVTGGAVATGGVINTGGTKTTSGGTTTNTGGNNPTGGTSATGGAQPMGGSAGTGGTTGATCSNTSTDWHNCGSCGHACQNQGQFCSTSCCAAGQCAPFWGPCFTHADGFANCSQACTSIGTSCVAAGCSRTAGTSPQYTWAGWATGSETACSNNLGPQTGSGASCDSALPWNATSEIVRCCCAEP